MKNVLLGVLLYIITIASTAHSESWDESLIGKIFVDEQTQILFITGNEGTEALQNEAGTIISVNVMLLDEESIAGEHCMFLNPTDGSPTTGLYCLMDDGTLQSIFGNQTLIAN